jgi:hypothetical protein
VGKAYNHPMILADHVASKRSKISPKPNRAQRNKAMTARLEEQAAKQFSQLALQLRRETRYESALDRIVSHPAYRKIVEMGDRALPHLLRDLKVQDGHWYWALAAITHTRPPKRKYIAGDDRQFWLSWGRQHGYL